MATDTGITRVKAELRSLLLTSVVALRTMAPEGEMPIYVAYSR